MLVDDWPGEVVVLFDGIVIFTIGLSDHHFHIALSQLESVLFVGIHLLLLKFGFIFILLGVLLFYKEPAFKFFLFLFDLLVLLLVVWVTI